MGSDFKVTVYGERGEVFDKVFGTRTVNVLLPFPHMVMLGGKAEPESVYMLDVAMLTPEQHERLVQHIAQEFAAPLDDVRAYLKADGMPIRAIDTVMTVENPQKWLLDDDMPGYKEIENSEDLMSDLDDDEVEEFDGYDAGYEDDF